METAPYALAYGAVCCKMTTGDSLGRERITIIPPFELLGKTTGVYPLLAMTGIFVAGLFACRMAKRQGYDDNDMIVLLLFAGIGVMIGGNLLYGITNIRYLFDLFLHWREITSFPILLRRLHMIFGGSVFYGGLLGGILSGYLYAKWKKLDISGFSDILAPIAPLFHTFGRIGCFLGGCCYGVECRFGFVYTQNIIAQANGVRRFPVQLLEASLNFLLFLLLWQALKKGKWKGMLFCIYLSSYAFLRFFLEFLRGDSYRGFLLGLSTSQWISIPLFLIAGGMLMRRRWENGRQSD